MLPRAGARILLISPPPLDEDAWAGWCEARYGVPKGAESNRDHATTAAYAAACVRVGAETGIPTLDLHSELLAQDDWKALLGDGLHPNAKGGEAIFRAVRGAINVHFPDLSPGQYGDEALGKLPLDFPDHKAIDIDAIDESFARHRELHRR